MLDHRCSVSRFWDLAYRDGSFRRHWDPPGPPAELVALLAAGVVPAGSAALDVGCGGGREAIYLARCGYRALGLESSPAALTVARARAAAAGVEVDWLLGTALKLPLAEAAVALVVDRGCLHLLDGPHRRLYAREVRRVLAPGGVLLLRGAARDGGSDDDPDDGDDPDGDGPDDGGGCFGLTAGRLDRLFPSPAFSRGPLLPFTLAAPAGDLAAHLVVLRRESKR